MAEKEKRQYLDKAGLAKFWLLTKGKFLPLSGGDVSGNLTVNGQTLITSANIGQQSVANADKVDGWHVDGMYGGIFYQYQYGPFTGCESKWFTFRLPAWTKDLCTINLYANGENRYGYAQVKVYSFSKHVTGSQTSYNAPVFDRIGVVSFPEGRPTFSAQISSVMTSFTIKSSLPLSVEVSDTVPSESYNVSYGTFEVGQLYRRTLGEEVTCHFIQTETYFRAQNSVGAIELLTNYNRGIYDRTLDRWLIAVNNGNGNTILNSGNVGIGTFEPDAKLHVAGSAHITGVATVDGTLTCKANLIGEEVISRGAITAEKGITSKGSLSVSQVEPNIYFSRTDGTTVRICAPEARRLHLDATKITLSGVLVPSTEASQSGIKLQDTYLTTVGKNLLLQGLTTLRFGGSQWNWDQWAGLSYDITNKVINFGTADGSVFNYNTTPQVGTLHLPGIRNLTTNGNLNIKPTGNVGIGGDAVSNAKLKVNGYTYITGDCKIDGIIENGNFYTDADGWVYTPALRVGDESNEADIVLYDSDGNEHIFQLQKAIELGIFN